MMEGICMDTIDAEWNYVDDGQVNADHVMINGPLDIDNQHWLDDYDNYLDLGGTSGNLDAILSYADPLAHSGEYQMDTMDFGEHSGDTYSRHVAAGYVQSHNGGIMPALSSVNQLAGVEHGMLVDRAGIADIVAMGEIEGTEHTDSQYEHRSEAVKKAFLHMNGYDSVPEGYEVHHIVPLSEGGADDVHNMVLLSEEDHDLVTEAHREFYGWGQGK